MAQPVIAAAEGKRRAAVVERIEIFTVEFEVAEAERESSLDAIEMASSPIVSEIVDSAGAREGEAEYSIDEWLPRMNLR